MDLVDNQIFINLVVNYCRTETSYFNFRSIQNSYFFSLFPSYKKIFFFLFNNIIEDYSSKWKTKKQKEEKKKAKKYYQTNYDKLREKSR